MQKYVKEFGDARLTKVPADLDTKPYRDEHDTDLLRRMEKGIRGDKAPTGIDAPRLRRKIGTTIMQLRSKMGRKK